MIILMAGDSAFSAFKNIASFNNSALAIFGNVASIGSGQAQTSSVGDLPDPSALRGGAGSNQTNALASLERGQSMTASLLNQVVSQIGQLYSSEAATRSAIANNTIQIAIAGFQIAYYSAQISQLQSQIQVHPELATLVQVYQNLLAQAQMSRDMNMEMLRQNDSRLAGVVSQLFESITQEGNLQTKEAQYAELINQVIGIMSQAGEKPKDPQGKDLKGDGHQILEGSIQTQPSNLQVSTSSGSQDRNEILRSAQDDTFGVTSGPINGIFQPMKNLFTKAIGAILGQGQTRGS